MAKHQLTAECQTCGKILPKSKLIPARFIRASITDEIKKDHPQWSADGFICRTDINHYRNRYIQSLIETEKGELTSLEKEVVESLNQQEILSRNVDMEFERTLTFGERLSDKIADFGGSWTFLIIFAIFLVIWMIINSTLLLLRVFDPYPYILLNLILSCIAAIQAPVIMMSQNRQEAKDRLRSQHDYQVNMKAELEIRQLHEKVDHLLSSQWERLVEIQQVQLEIMGEITAMQGKGKTR